MCAHSYWEKLWQLAFIFRFAGLMEGTDFLNFKVSIPQDKTKGGAQSRASSCHTLPSAQLGRQEGQSGCPMNHKKLGCLSSTDLPTGAGASAQPPGPTWAGRNFPPKKTDTA